MTRKQPQPLYYSQVLDRVMQILDCFSSDSSELRFVELAGRLKLHRSTLYRLLEAMRSYGLLELDRTAGSYHLGLKLFELGALAIGRLEIDKCASPILEELVAKTGETAHLCVLDGSYVVYIAKVESSYPIRIPSTVGRRNLAYCTGVGKALLAHLSEEELDSYLAQTPLRALTKKTVTSGRDLKKILAAVRIRGYAIDDEEISEGVRCIGSPVRDHSGKVVAGISIAGPSIRITKGRIGELAPFVMEAANAISEKLGYWCDEAGM